MRGRLIAPSESAWNSEKTVECHPDVNCKIKEGFSYDRAVSIIIKQRWFSMRVRLSNTLSVGVNGYGSADPIGINGTIANDHPIYLVCDRPSI